MKYSQIRIALLTFTLSLASVSFYNSLYEQWNGPLIELPKVEAESPIVVKICLEYEKPAFYNVHDSGGSGGCGGADNNDCNAIPHILLPLPKMNKE